MKKILPISLFLLFALQSGPQPVAAFWMWTPETNKWVNPKYSVKDSPQSQLQYALELFEADQDDKALNEFRKLVKNYPKAREAAEAQYYVGRILEKKERFHEAFKAYQDVVDKYPFSERAAEIVGRQYNIGVLTLEGKDGRSDWARAVTGTEHHVIEVFRAVIKNAPYGEHAAPAQYKIGLYLKERGMFEEAREEFEKTVNNYPTSEWAQSARYQIALADAQRSPTAAYEQKITEAAIEGFENFIVDFPESELTDDAKRQIADLRNKEAKNQYMIGEFYRKQKNYSAAKVYYNVVADDYGKTAWAVKSLERIQEINLKQ